MTATAALKDFAAEAFRDMPPAPAVQVARAKAVQKVAMGRRELELYVKDGRPTGALLSALAGLKGLNPEVIAQKAKVAPSVVKALLIDGAQSDIKPATIRAVAAALGLDLADLRLTPGEVHMLDLGRGNGGIGPGGFGVRARAAGLLLRGATIARIDAGNLPGFAAGRMREFHAAQYGEVRAIIAGSRMPLMGRRFSPSAIPGAKWVCGSEVKSSVQVTSLELCTQLQELDMNRVEFGQLFRGEDKTSWDDIRAATRELNISRSELLDIIRAAASAPRRKPRGSRAKPSLRLVDIGLDASTETA